MCMLPSRPRVSPPTRPMYCAKMRPGETPRMKKTAMSRWRGKQHVLGAGEQGRADRNGFLSAPHIDAAHDLALPVEFALDAVFHLPHHRHVIETLVRQGGFRGPLIGSFRV